jgi:hypothetical protein
MPPPSSPYPEEFVEVVLLETIQLYNDNVPELLMPPPGVPAGLPFLMVRPESKTVTFVVTRMTPLA